MYQLISVTRQELDICESFYKTKEEAFNAMVEDIILMTDYESLYDIRMADLAGECSLTDNDAWAETSQFGTGQWKIVEVPQTMVKIDTPDGVIMAEAHGDHDDYPGIWITKDKKTPFYMIAAVEYNSVDKRIQVETYQEGADEPHSIIDYETGEDLM